MPIIHRPYVPPDDQLPLEESHEQGSETNAGDPITFYCDSMHIYSSLYSAVLFLGEQMEEREPILRARIKVSPQMLKAISLLASKHVREYEEAVGLIELPSQVYEAWGIEPDKS
jgi:hypothetical protein